MKFKDFFLNAVSQELGDGKAQARQQEVTNEILYEFVLREFNSISGLSKQLLIDDPDQKITPFIEKFTVLKKEDDKEAVLMNVASFLDEMILNNRFWFVVPYDELYICDNKQIAFNWFEMEKYSVVDQKKISREVKTKYQDMMSNKLNSGMVTGKLLNDDLTKEAFVYFLIKSFYPQLPSRFNLNPIKWLNVALTKINMTPEEKYFVQEILQAPSSLGTCKEIAAQYCSKKKKSICIPIKKNDQAWDFGFHTEQGRNKKSIQNEDSYSVILTNDQKSVLFMVADGVSTANIGRGKIVATQIQEAIEDQKDEMIQFMEAGSDLSTSEWIRSCRKQIFSILIQVNQSCTDELNRRMEQAHISDPQPMSSTVMIGFANENRVVFGHLGDSHLFYIHNGKLMRLNEEHNVMMDRISHYIDYPEAQAFQDHKTDKHLERVIPLVEYDDKEKKFKAKDLENKVTFFSFFPELGSVVIAATDGLIDCLGSAGNEFENEKDVLTTYNDALAQSENPKDVARIMGRKADKAAGVDNITLVVLKNKNVSSQLPKREETDPSRQKMKKIS